MGERPRSTSVRDKKAIFMAPRAPKVRRFRASNGQTTPPVRLGLLIEGSGSMNRRKVGKRESGDFGVAEPDGRPTVGDQIRSL
jgi:hypothetical protein